MPELSKGEQVEIFDQLKLNHHKYRYIIHTVHFSLQKLLNCGIAEPLTDLLVIEYTGVDKAQIVLQQ